MVEKILFLMAILLSILFVLQGAATFASDTLDNAFRQEGPFESVADTAGYSIKGENIDSELMSMISTIITAALSFLGVIFLILMIYGGYLWMTAGGNEQQVEKAKSLITAAIIGLIIVVSAYAISYFVMAKLGGGALK